MCTFYNLLQAAEQLVEEFFPQHLQIFHQLTLVERTDMLRYMIIYVYGGVYADLDVECYRKCSVIII